MYCFPCNIVCTVYSVLFYHATKIELYFFIVSQWLVINRFCNCSFGQWLHDWPCFIFLCTLSVIKYLFLEIKSVTSVRKEFFLLIIQWTIWLFRWISFIHLDIWPWPNFQISQRSNLASFFSFSQKKQDPTERRIRTARQEENWYNIGGPTERGKENYNPRRKTNRRRRNAEWTG